MRQTPCFQDSPVSASQSELKMIYIGIIFITFYSRFDPHLIYAQSRQNHAFFSALSALGPCVVCLLRGYADRARPKAVFVRPASFLSSILVDPRVSCCIILSRMSSKLARSSLGLLGPSSKLSPGRSRQIKAKPSLRITTLHS